MKKWLAIVLAAVVCVPLAAVSEETQTVGVTANAVAKSENVYQITAPFSGVLEPFDWENGDSVEASDALFALNTVKVYAPADGLLQAVFVKPGDMCEDVIGRYGMIACIEKVPELQINASTSGAYNDDDNRLIHVGETVYFEETKDTDNEGEGRVIAVDGNHYVVEVTAGDFERDVAVRIYRDEKMGTKTCIGTGDTVRAADVAVVGSGRVLHSAISEGQRVRQGQLLFELAAADAEDTVTDALVRAGNDGALELAASPGQQVYKGQLLAKVHDLSAMNVVAEVDEMDLDRVHVGDTIAVVFDRYSGEQINGTVREIARIGVAKQNATYYNVTIAVSTSLEVLPGMNATVWLPAVR